MPTLPPEYADLHRDTLAVRAAVERTAYGENSEALFLTSGYVQPSAEAAAKRFAGEEDGYTYGRYGNPTVSSFEQRLAALEGAEACISTASGMSAILMMCMGLLKAGDHVLCSRSMFGSTIKLIGSDLAKFGVESSFLPQADAAAWQAAIRPNTKLLFAETPTNPLTEVCDIRALADIAHNAGALLCVDNCFATPALQRPMALGADIVMHSGTKYLDGQGRVMAGALCASEELVTKSFLPVLKSAWHDARALQRLGGAQGPGNAGHPHAGAVGASAGPGAVAGEPPLRSPGCFTRGLPAIRNMHWPWPSSRVWVGPCCRLKFRRRAMSRRASAPSTCSTACACCRCPPTWATPKPWWPTRPAPRTAASRPNSVPLPA